MNTKTTYILIGLVGILLAGLGLYVAFSDDEKPSVSGLLLSSFADTGVKDTEITSLEVTLHGGKPTIYSREASGRWRCIDPVKVRVDPTAIESVIREFLNAKVSDKSIESAKDLAKYDLVDPPVKITLKKGVDREETISIGTITIGEDRAMVYVTTSDSPKKVQAIKRESIRSLFKAKKSIDGDAAAMVLDLSDLRERRMLAWNVNDVLTQTDKITITHGKELLSLARRQGGWFFEVPANLGEAEAEVPGATPNPEALYSVRQLIAEASNLQVADAKDFIDNPTNMAEYGLDPGSPDLIKIELVRPGPKPNEPVREILLVGKAVKDKPDQVYARFEGDAAVAMIPNTPLKFLRRTLENPRTLRAHDLMRLNPTKIDAIDIVNGTGKIELRKGEGDFHWNLFEGDVAKKANFTQIQNLIVRLNSPGLVQEFPPANYTAENMGFTPSSQKISIWEEGIIPPKDPPAAGKIIKPALKEKPTVELIFGKPNVNTIYVRRIMNGLQADFEIPLNVMDQFVTKPGVEYLDIALKSFNPGSVLKIELKVGKETLVLEKEAEKWAIAGADPMKKKKADGEKVGVLLKELSSIIPLKPVAENPDEGKLNSLKLTDASALMIVRLQLKDEMDKPFVYYFGEDTVTKTGQYMRIGGQPLIVEATKAIYEGNRSLDDFLDRQVYKIPADKKVVSLKLLGWAKQRGDKPAEREFELKDDKWTKKTQLNYEIEPTAVSNFLLDVTSVKAEKFIGTKELPEYQLDVNKDALLVTLNVEGGKPVTLLLGGEDPKSPFIYAKSSETGDEIFTLLKDRYRNVRDNPNVFQKLP